MNQFHLKPTHLKLRITTNCLVHRFYAIRFTGIYVSANLYYWVDFSCSNNIMYLFPQFAHVQQYTQIDVTKKLMKYLFLFTDTLKLLFRQKNYKKAFKVVLSRPVNRILSASSKNLVSIQQFRVFNYCLTWLLLFFECKKVKILLMIS